ncbi:MAG TPA: YifB family Mg chelatase-like AAA ATPase [Firmicutes bacterium]|nr:YifB family Mg chelatase-like AAA ATPase [Bacillota bacterium]HOQ23062.1 YifB family Mg chelatase-like AAA ATPase [Bacillota bacterium]HPT66960.1 YifB family Mg chelatase-like AAA ATPase [Bacillota bacterium]
MLAKVMSASVLGVDGFTVAVEVDLGLGLPSFDIVGLPDTAVRESRERVRSAIKNSGYEFPAHKITINLAPANVRKEGAAYDLPIAVGILAAHGSVRMDLLERTVIVGELALDGQVRPVNGVLAMAQAVVEGGADFFVVPRENLQEAAVVEGIMPVPVWDIRETVSFLNGDWQPEPVRVDWEEAGQPVYPEDFRDVQGHDHAKRALEIAAAGGHNLLFIGPPGSGKTMLARRLPSILPPLTREEAMELSRVYSVAGMLPTGVSLLTQRPFRSPHHTISAAGLIGGGRIPRPGEVSLAHYGVLYMDEFPEFPREALEALRQPLEDGVVTIARAATTLTYPAKMMLVASQNPCPCGFLGDAARPCVCTPIQVHRYRSRISGPLLDRIDLVVEVPRLRHDELLGRKEGESSAAIRARVTAARSIQTQRLAGMGLYCNAHMGAKELKIYCALGEAERRLVAKAMQTYNLSGRAYARLLRVARTIADLAGSDRIELPHLAEALQYRYNERGLPGAAGVR